MLEVHAYFPTNAKHQQHSTMHLKHTLIVFVLALGAILSAPLKLHAEAPSSLDVIKKQFGILTEVDDCFNFVPVTKVPLVIGQSFGWLLRVKTDRAKVVVREEQTLAAPPASFGTGDNASDISSDGRTCITELHLEPDEDGLIYNFWEVAKGDPAGPASFRLFIDDELVASFKFILVSNNDAQDDKDTAAAPKQKHSPVPPFLEQQLERLKTSLAASEQYLKGTETAVQITALRVQAARHGDDKAELHTAETHLHTLTEERKNIEASTALLERAVKEMEATIERRDAVAREKAKAAPAAKEMPKREPAAREAQRTMMI